MKRGLLTIAAPVLLTAVGALGVGSLSAPVVDAVSSPGGGGSGPPPTPSVTPRSIATATPTTTTPADCTAGAPPAGGRPVGLSPHLLVGSGSFQVNCLKDAWNWALSTYGRTIPDGGTEFTRWVEACSVSPFNNSCTGEFAHAFRSLNGDYYVAEAFSENQKVLFTPAAMISIAFPSTLIGQPRETVEALVQGWEGPTQSQINPNAQMWTSPDGKTRVAISTGDSGTGWRGPSATLYSGPYVRVTEPGVQYSTMGLQGNPAFERGEPTVEIWRVFDQVQYFNFKGPIDPAAAEGFPSEGGEGDAGGGAPAGE